MKVINLLHLIVLVSIAGQSYAAHGQDLVKTVAYSDSIKDYGPILTNAIQDVVKAGKGIVKVKYGIYPLLTPVAINVKSGSPDIVVIGVKNSKGKLPVFKDTDTSRAPHHFFHFRGNTGKPTMRVSLSNLELIGNNVSYSPTHPFFGKTNLIYFIAIAGLDIANMKVENVTIRNFYGRGILIANYFNAKYDRRHRVESPVVRNCKILNVWGYSKKDDSGDGVEFFSANKPLIENNLIINNLPDSRYFGRCGIVLEHNTEKATIRNNRVGGYTRNVHIECDWGGHLIERNHFSQSSVAVNLSEDCGQPDSLKKEFRPIVIRNNTMTYKDELITYKIPRSPFSFISIYKPSSMLEGLQILNNKMVIQSTSPKKQVTTARTNNEQSTKRYIDIKTQDKVTIKGNSFN